MQSARNRKQRQETRIGEQKRPSVEQKHRKVMAVFEHERHDEEAEEETIKGRQTRLTKRQSLSTRKITTTAHRRPLTARNAIQNSTERRRHMCEYGSS